MKRCSKCGETKALDLFSKNNREKDGLRRHCKSCCCKAEIARRERDPEGYRKRANENRLKSIDSRREWERKWRAENIEKIREADRKRTSERYHNDENYRAWLKEYNSKNADAISSRRKAWAERNAHAVSERKSRWASENRDAVRAAKRRYKERNPEKVAASGSIRRASKLNASPKWLSKKHKKEIAAIYKEAKSMGSDWHVDHIVPLRGKSVCGLHVPWNLRVIPAEDNHKKHAKLIERDAVPAFL